jgi:hypothetical protein
MGTTRECLTHYGKLVEGGYLDFKNCKVIELGAQTVHFDDKPFFAEFCKKVGVNPDIVRDFYYNMPGRLMHEKFGHEYECIDLDDFNGETPILTWDLNTKICPDDHKGKYDLCTNFGTTEHLFNQTNAFRLVHDLTKVGGIIVHILPMADMNHGLFNYNPILFQCLAKFNNYDMLGLYMTSNTDPSTFVPYRGHIPGDKTYLHCLLRKTTNDEFENPAQVYESGVG